VSHLPVKLEVRRLPPGQRTIAQLAKRYYHSSSRSVPIRKRNPFLAEIGNNTDLRDYFATDPRPLVIVIPEIDIQVQ
jgi:hypothetical protein